jgi:hypothetical protein
MAGDKNSRVPVSTFSAALSLQGVQADGDEVECMLANMIYRVSGASPTCANARAT